MLLFSIYLPPRSLHFSTFGGSDSVAGSGSGIDDSNTGHGAETPDRIILKFCRGLGVFESLHMPVLMTIGAGVFGRSRGRIFPLPVDNFQ